MRILFQEMMFHDPGMVVAEPVGGLELRQRILVKAEFVAVFPRTRQLQVLADGQNLSPQAVERVLDEWRARGGVVAASYDGARGHPLALGRTDWDEVPDEGLRDRPVHLVPCDDLGSPGDVDVPEDLETL